MRKILPRPKKPNTTQIFNQLLCVDTVKTFSQPEQNSDAHGKIVSAALIDQPSKDVSDTPVAPKTPVNDNPEPSENSGRVKDLETQVLLLKRQLFSATIKNSNQVCIKWDSYRREGGGGLPSMYLIKGRG